MSSILQALEKKREQTRRRPQEIVLYGNTPQPSLVPAPGSRLPLLLIGIPLGILCVLAGGFCLRWVDARMQAPQPVVQAPAPAVPAVEAPAVTDPQLGELVAQLNEFKAALSELKPPAPQVSAAEDPAVPVPAVTPADSAPPAPAAVPEEPAMPGEIRVQGVLSVDGERALLIEGKVLQAGDTLEGRKILEIGSDFVLLEGWLRRIPLK